jgi:hypothetical protein
MRLWAEPDGHDTIAIVVPYFVLELPVSPICDEFGTSESRH